MIDRQARRAALARIAKDNLDGDDAVQIVDLAICLILAAFVVGVLLVCFQ